ncbi:leucine-rich repeat transmembrane neuronal protein 2 [Balaenoptera acutorostrata]|uniref:Leucine-rich repeat transmembrane neuronal protein 2 n=1 Tax=Balaenoptera acutorostrata TaxID=9767 RepID=A0A383ZB52_BALAC|nr:leucine-rich repeat transmembrane neuronal protein 2 [Balaenoptera acutorostrata]
MGLHFKWPLGAPMLAAIYAMSMVLKMLPALGMACPPKCRCEKLLFYCDSQGFHSVPNTTDKGSLGLSLRHNHITELERDQFASFSQLTWLHLDHNQISTVKEDAFQGLYKLKELILSSNKISYLPNTTFTQLINLQNLDLSFNQLSSLHPELFYGLRKLQTLHLRSNSLRTIPVRLFWDCRSLEFLDLSTNRLRSLARNGFAGLIKLRELHLEHNQLTKINFAHFLRLSSLHTLFLQWNKISNLTCGMEWTWGTLEKLDLTGNEIKAIDLTVFETMPNLKILLMDNNKLNSLDSKILNSLRSLTTVGLSGNLWECSPRICALASWLGSFQGRWEHSILCHSPDHTQGEDILDAVHGFQLCWNLSTTVTAMATTYKDPTTEYTKRISSSSYHVGDKEIPTTAGIAVTTEEHFPEPDNAIFTQRVITGTMALLFSFFFIIFIVFISRKCCPPTLRRIRQCSMIQNHRQLRSQTRLHMSNMSDQGPYNEYEPTHEGPFIIINGYGQCKCQQLPYKECEV